MNTNCLVSAAAGAVETKEGKYQITVAGTLRPLLYSLVGILVAGLSNLEHSLSQEMEVESMEGEGAIGKRHCALEQRERGQVRSTAF